MNDKPCEALFDSGSTHCFINDSLRKQLNLQWIEQGEATISQATTTCNALGIVKIQIQIGVMIRNHLFYAIPSERESIIGVDAMKKFRIYRDENGKVYQKINSQNYQVGSEKDHENEIRINVAELDKNQDPEIITLINKYEKVFAKEKGEIGQIKGEYCYINLENQIPINLKPYRTTVKDQERIDQQIKELLERKDIQKSTSNYSFPVVLVNKKDEGEKTRMCIDYRKLNAITIPERYPMPLIQDIENKMLNAEIFTTCNLPQTYQHIITDCPLFTDIRHKYTIITTQNTTQIINKLILNNKFTDFCKESLYVDDLVSSVNTKQETIEFHDVSTNIFKEKRQ